MAINGLNSRFRVSLSMERPNLLLFVIFLWILSMLSKVSCMAIIIISSSGNQTTQIKHVYCVYVQVYIHKFSGSMDYVKSYIYSSYRDVYLIFFSLKSP